MRPLIVSLLLLLPSLPVQASFQERNEAMALYKNGKYTEALEIFLTMAKSKKDVQQAEALLMAAQTAQRLQKEDQALELAESIRLKPYADFTKMRLLQNTSSWPELLSLSESADMTQWPEKLIFPAYMMRGDAYFATGNNAAAKTAYAEARKYTLSPKEKGRALLLEAEAAQKSGTTADQLLSIYDQVVTLKPKGGGVLQRAHLARAKIYADQGKEEAALAEIIPVQESGKRDAYWIAAAEIATAEVFETVGKPDEAKTHYQKALETKSAPADLTQQAREGLARLEAPKN